MRTALVAIVAVYIALGAWYASAIPFGQAPDESAHLLYITYLADHHDAPVFKPVGAGGYEFHQPPLYYALSLPAYLAAGRTAVRLFNVALGIGVILFTYLLCREVFPRRPWRAVAAAAFVAFLPMHVALCASVTNDILAEVIFTAGLWQMVRGLRAGWSWRISVVVGALAGLGLLTKSATAPLLLVGWMAAGLWRGRERPFAWRRLLGDLALMTLAALAIGGWWLARNQALYGDPLASRAFLEAFRGRPTPAYFLEQRGLSLFQYLVLVKGITFASFWGVFGTMNVFLPTWVYVALGIFTTAAWAGVIARLWSWRRLEGWQRQALLTLGFAALLVVLLFARFNMSYFQAQARYLFHVIGVCSMGMVWGISRLARRRAREAAAFLPAAVALVLAIVALPVWIFPQMAGG